MTWLRHSIEHIDFHGIQCRFTSDGYTALGWIMPDGVGVIQADGVTLECRPESICTDHEDGLRLARKAAANNHFERYDQGYTVISEGEWETAGNKWIKLCSAGLAGKQGTLSVHVAFKPNTAELLRFYTVYQSDPHAGQGIADQVRQGCVGGKIAAGEVVRTASGRLCTPFPKIDLDSERKAGNTLKRVDDWLMQNALAEAQARGDEFNSLLFKASMDKPQQADKDSAEHYLFGRQPAVIPSPLSLLTQPASCV